MNFALIASILWLFTTPEKEGLDSKPGESLISHAAYIIQNEADSSVLNAWEPGSLGGPGTVNTTKFGVNNCTKWTLQYIKDKRSLTIRTRSQNNTNNELAVGVNQSRDGKFLGTYLRHWNLTFANRTFGLDRWLIIDRGDGEGTGHNNTNPKCLQASSQNDKKGHRVELAACNKTDRWQRWRFCLCCLPPLPKGHSERDRVIERIPY